MLTDDILVSALLKPQIYPHDVGTVELVETHISWVILTGDYVYKIKKPVDFGFLDFSTLDKRQFYCQEELRLNQRLAPDLYLEVVSITGTREQPELHGSGDVIEYAVKMKQFSQSQQLDHVLERGELTGEQIDAVAGFLADFHQSVATADPASSFGDPDHVYQPVQENFVQILQQLPAERYREPLTRLESWSRDAYQELTSSIAARKTDGFVRECHGDMHLRNIAWIDNQPLVFDCIEFNPNLYWIDVINDVAFLVMDLQDRGQQRLAIRLLNAYLERTGDYRGVTMLRFYLLYRSMVLAKVNAIRAAQTVEQAERQHALQEFENYLKLGMDYVKAGSPLLMITHGLSGSGKSVVSAELAQHIGAIRIRSDVERKRLYGIRPDESAASATNDGIYTAAATQQTYELLLQLAEMVLQAGWSVIVDAAFLRREQRETFRQFSLQTQTTFRIIDLYADESVLQQRVRARQGDVSDANLDVLNNQLQTHEGLSAEEQAFTLTIDTQEELDYAALARQLTG